MIQRVGKIKACQEWLLGLALNVDYTYYDIEQRLKLWGILDGTESEKSSMQSLIFIGIGLVRLCVI